MGLVHVLENLAQPEELGHLIAAAFIATLWGVMSANVIWLPLGSRLKRLSELEAARMEIIIEGVAAIQAGSNPRVIAQKLTSLLPEPEEHENHERWLVTYADMVTLLMVLFIVLFAMSQVDQKKFNALKDGLAAGFGQSTSVLDGSSSILDQAGTSSMAPVAPSLNYQELTEVELASTSNGVAAAMQDAVRRRQD
eukprot:gene1692-1973_t